MYVTHACMSDIIILLEYNNSVSFSIMFGDLTLFELVDPPRSCVLTLLNFLFLGVISFCLLFSLIVLDEPSSCNSC